MRVIAFIIIAMSAVLGGCATNPFVTQEGTSTGYKIAQQPQSVAMATVIATRDVKLINQPSVLGERVGATLGGIVGLGLVQEATKNNALKVVFGTLAGAVGAEMGRQAAGNVSGQELVIKTEKGDVLTVAQSSADGVRFNPGQRVMLIGGGRVAPVIQ